MMYIYSTLSADVVYSTDAGEVLVHGGANIPDKHLLTPYGKVTRVTDDEYAALERNHLFKTHKENGYITADKHKTDADHAAAAMNGRDMSAPDTEESLISSDSTIEKIKDGVITRKAK